MAVNSFREDEELNAAEKSKIILRLAGYLGKHFIGILVVLITLGITVLIRLVNPLIIEEIIDKYIASKDYPGLIKMGILAAVINISLVVMVKIHMYVMSLISNRILRDIRQELYEHIQTLSFSFFDGRPTGKILARITGDVNSLKEVLNNAVTTLIPDFLTVIGVVVIMLAKDWRLALATLSSVPIMVLCVFGIEHISHERWQIHRKKSSNLNAYIHEDIAGIRVVQAFSAEEETRQQFGELTKEHQSSFMDACRFADMFWPSTHFSWGIGMIALYFVGIKVLGMPEVSVGLLVAFGTYSGMFWDPIMNLSNFINQLVTNITAAERVFEILDMDADIVDKKDALTLPVLEGVVDFENVSFSYDDKEEVLSDVSFTVNSGETIALVGETGAGKSTIVNLISRFYDVTSGAIKIDGFDLRNVSIASLRNQMGVMMQDNFIFQGTVKENILYGRLDATDEEVVKVAKAVNAHDFIMELEDGYDTKLKERGAGLSIGQRQLIAFARTMISNPRILILDEATSSIDSHTELAVQRGIEALLSGRTSFVIAHRLSTIKNADRIFVVNNKGIEESGTHDELMRKHGAYYNLYMAQFS